MRPVAVDCVLVENGDVLMVLRDIEPFKGYWVLPGGHVEDRETVEEALKREMKEELGIEIEILDLVGVFSDPKRDPRGTISIAFLARPLDNNIRLNEEAREYRWFGWESLPDRIGFDHREIIKRAREVWTSLNRENNKNRWEGSRWR